METILDDGHSWFLESISFGDALTITVVEGIKAQEPMDIIIQDINLGEGYAVEIKPESRKIEIVFEDVFAYQCTNESYALGEPEYEIYDKGFVRVYERSRYLDYIKAYSMIHKLQPDVIHYCILSEDDIIDVISTKQPTLYESIDDF